MKMAQDRLEECVWSPYGGMSDHQRLGGRHPGPKRMVFSAGGKLWLEERTPEQLKGEGG